MLSPKNTKNRLVVAFSLFIALLLLLVSGVIYTYFPLSHAYQPDTGFRNFYLLFVIVLLIASVIFAWMLGVGIKAAEESLWLSEERFRTVTNHTYDWEYWRSHDGTLAYVSPSCERISGYTPEEFLKDPELITKIIHPEDVDKFSCHLEEKTGSTPDLCGTTDYRIITKSGEERWIAHICQEVFDDCGRSLGRRASNRDITESKLAKAQLIGNQAELQAVYDNAPVMICLVDVNRRILYANSEFTTFLGISAEELKGGHACGVFGCCNVNDDPHGCGYGENCKKCSLLRTIEDSFNTGASHRNDEHSITLVRGGVEKELTLIGSTALVKSDDSNHLLICLHDITERKQIEEKLLTTNRKLEDANFEMSVINTQLDQKRQELQIARDQVEEANERVTLATKAGSVGIWDYDVVNKRLVWDEEMLRLYGVLPNAFDGLLETWIAAIHPEDVERSASEFQMALNGEQDYNTTFRVVWQDNSVHYIRALAVVDRDKLGEPLRIIGTNWDISSFKEAEDALLAFSEELKEKNMQLETALVKAEQATLAKSQFLANMSHEIRTPLTAVIGFTDLALKNRQQERQEECIRKIGIAGQSLLHLVNDILDFSKIEAGELKIEMAPFQLKELIESRSSMLMKSAEDKGVKLRWSCRFEPFLVGDSHRLGQILTNLLSNAIKFTERGSVDLTVELLEEKSDRIKFLFSVSDTGIGISGADLQRIFESFTQADGSTSRKYGGTGLGLSISKKLVEMMDGEISCKSSPGVGSTFSFTAWIHIGESKSCWVESENTHSAEAVESSCSGLSGLRILVADDNRINQELVFELLKEVGAAVDIANDGSEALSMIADSDLSYDLVLMDIQMPVMDGYEATRLIRSDPRFSRLPVVALTGNALVDELSNTVESGFDGYLAKPYTMNSLLNTIGLYTRKNEPTVSSKINAGVDKSPSVPEIAGLETRSAISAMDNNKKLYLSILQSFVDHEFNAAALVEEELVKADFVAARRIVHNMKASAGAIGATQLESLARELEKAISSDGVEKTEGRLLDDFALEIDRIVKSITSATSSADVHSSGVPFIV
ncbi:MAG: PAS domain-containing protein [Desulfuromonadaceae bacterium]|nr:PAS domain-containing protein [Desulfuromonadaceae bacterium]MDD2855006.1 PAS domain-containing protein [Desulfuromonadaceae bacterium]